MLQRIQTVFLLLASASMLVASVTPLASFFYNGELVVFEAIGTYMNDTLHDITWGLFALGIISSVLALVTIFLYKNRILQIRISVFNLIVMLGFYLYFGFLMYQLHTSTVDLEFRKIGIGLIMPLIAIIFIILAIRNIGADEVLIRSLNRLRK